MSFFLYLLHDPVSDQHGNPFVSCVYGGDYPLKKIGQNANITNTSFYSALHKT